VWARKVSVENRMTLDHPLHSREVGIGNVPSLR